MIDTANYGKALYELAAENGSQERIRAELETVRQALIREPSYVTLLDTPAVASDVKIGLLRQAFDGADAMLLNFLSILCQKRELCSFQACADAFDRCYDEAHGILRATAITARPMSEAQCAALCKKLEAMTGKNVMLENRTDPQLLGGITLRYGGVQLEDSIRSRLEHLRRSLRETIV